MILLTGATGFIGTALLKELLQRNINVLAASRYGSSQFPDCVNQVSIGDINSATDWSRSLENVEVVIHTAARVHVMQDTVDDPLNEFRRINVEGTLNLARQAANLNVKRFIFISSIKVNGESTLQGRPFKGDDQPAPDDPYAISKWETEIGLWQLGNETGIEVVIIRPPLIYGPGVKANFLSMMRWIYPGLPLPLGTIHNKRSLLALDNLVDFIITCIEHPAAVNQTFLVADGQDLSTTELLQHIGKALGKRARLIPFPAGLLVFIASILGKRAIAQRLCGFLQVDISKARLVLDWEPPISVDKAMVKVAENFKNAQCIDRSG